MNSVIGIICGTPDEHCTGGKLMSDQHLGTSKVHRSREEAFKCYCHYMTTVLGYTRVNSREFHIADQPVRIIPKRGKFGGRLRQGKSEKSSKSKRLMPKVGRGLIS